MDNREDRSVQATVRPSRLARRRSEARGSKTRPLPLMLLAILVCDILLSRASTHGLGNDQIALPAVLALDPINPGTPGYGRRLRRAIAQ
jgi:hypothetical protein